MLRVDRDSVIRLWFQRQGLVRPRGHQALTRRRFVDHLQRTGALQQDTINVLDRAHYLTLWSRFGGYDRRRLDRWIYRERVAYEYWGHEASIVPITHLPLGRRRMRGFPPPDWRGRAWWPRYATSPASKRRVLRRLRAEGPLESSDFERRADESADAGSGMQLPKEDKRSLALLWHDGRIAVCTRRHFRRVYDLAQCVYPDADPATPVAYEDSWLFTGLSGNGIASERHLVNYWTAPHLDAATRRRVIARNLKRKRIVELRVGDLRGAFYALPQHLEGLAGSEPPEGTTLIGPFDSLLWQRRRAEELLDFSYRVEIYTPASKRQYGYYVLPILHDGRLVGRLDPRLDRERGRLEIRAVHLEPGFRGDRRFFRGLRESLADLARFVGAEEVEPPAGTWRRRLA